MDFSPMLNAVDLSGIVSAILSVGVALLAPGIARYGVKALLRFLPSDQGGLDLGEPESGIDWYTDYTEADDKRDTEAAGRVFIPWAER